MRNIAENPRVALIIDHYEEEWSYLAYILIHGQAHVVEDPNEYMLAQRNLRDKYPQYRAMVLSFERNPMVRIDVERPRLGRALQDIHVGLKHGRFPKRQGRTSVALAAARSTIRACWPGWPVG
jgi:hypothetical protein